MAAKYCIQQIEKGVMGGGTTTLHILTLLKEIISTFPKSYIKVNFLFFLSNCANQLLLIFFAVVV